MQGNTCTYCLEKQKMLNSDRNERVNLTLEKHKQISKTQMTEEVWCIRLVLTLSEQRA